MSRGQFPPKNPHESYNVTIDTNRHHFSQTTTGERKQVGFLIRKKMCTAGAEIRYYLPIYKAINNLFVIFNLSISVSNANARSTARFLMPSVSHLQPI